MKYTFPIALILTSLLSACGSDSGERANLTPENESGNILKATLFSSANKDISDRLVLKSSQRKQVRDISFKVASSAQIPPYISFVLEPNGTFAFKTKREYTEAICIPVVLTVNGEENKVDITFHTQIIQSNGDDPLLSQQWHLKNTGQNAFKENISVENKATPGIDINLGLLHDQGVTGRNVNIAVVDDGLDISHEDLATNIIPNKSWDFVNNDNDPSYYEPDSAIHGTAVAGIVASAGFNNRGGRGVAPDAKLQGLNFLQKQNFSNWSESTGGSRTNNALVINMSFGSPTHGFTPQDFTTPKNSIEEQHLKKVTTNNNAGKGVFLANSSGNNFQSAQFGFARRRSYQGELTLVNASLAPRNSSFYTTTVSGLSPIKNKPNIGSTVGSAIFISAPGFGADDQAQTITTDISGCNYGYSTDATTGFNKGTSNNLNCNYTNTFTGTSSATPVLAGVATLLFGANDSLTWRDVRHILGSTATTVDLQSKPVIIQESNGDKFTARLGWVTNKAGYSFHNWYGLGMVNATKAVQMATNGYTLLPPLQETAFISSGMSIPLSIPEGPTGIEQTISINDDYIIEGVQLKLSLSHRRKNDLLVELVSPSGTHSILLTPRTLIGYIETGADTTDFNNTVLLSNAFYGEKSKGDWKIKIYDTNSGDFKYDHVFGKNIIDKNPAPGQLTALSLRIYGH